MMRRVFTAYRVELAKALRHKPTYIGPVLVLVAVLLTALQRPPEADGHGDYAYIALATAQALNIVGLAVLLIYTAGLIAGEVRDGSIRGMLTRPLLRHEYVLAKLLHAVTFAAVLNLFCGVTAWCVALAMGDLHGVTYGGDLLHPAGAMLRAYVLGGLLALVPLATAAAFALFVSTVARGPVVAASAAVLGWCALEIVKYPLRLEVVLFTTYLEAPWSVFLRQTEGLPATWGPVLRNVLLTSTPAFALFTAGAVAMLRNRNLG